MIKCFTLGIQNTISSNPQVSLGLLELTPTVQYHIYGLAISCSIKGDCSRHWIQNQISYVSVFTQCNPTTGTELPSVLAFPNNIIYNRLWISKDPAIRSNRDILMFPHFITLDKKESIYLHQYVQYFSGTVIRVYTSITFYASEEKAQLHMQYKKS